MNWRDRMKIKSLRSITQILALFIIYLVFSITLISANSMAILNVDVYGINHANNFRLVSDTTDFHIVSSSDINFNNGMATLGCENLQCTNTQLICQCTRTNNTTDWTMSFGDEDIPASIDKLIFTISQINGTPEKKNVTLWIDKQSPKINKFNVTKKNDGFSVYFNVTDRAISGSTVCSGLDNITIFVNDEAEYLPIAPGVCSVAKYYNKTGLAADNYEIRLVARDLAGNSGVENVTSIDLVPPEISDNFEIMEGANTLTTFSSKNSILAKVVVHIDDKNITSVYGNLTKLNSGPIGQTYRKMSATCFRLGAYSTSYDCVFNNIQIRPGSESLSILVNATNKAGNNIVKKLVYNVNFMNDAGDPIYIGPDKKQCLDDLSECYIKPGHNIFYVDLANGSSYNKTGVKIGQDANQMFGICKFNNTWICMSPFNIADSAYADGSKTRIFIVNPSYDDYGNELPALQRDVIIDKIAPISISSLNADNSILSQGSKLTLSVKVSDKSKKLKIYINTSQFTTKDIQNGNCIFENGNWTCKIDVNDFISGAITVTTPIIIEDLAGNKLSMPYIFNVLENTDETVPNVISSITPQNEISIDRRTASFIDVKTLSRLKIEKSANSKVVGLDIESCTAEDSAGMDLHGNSEPYVLRESEDPILAIWVGGNTAQLPESGFDINCTLALRVSVGRKLYTEPQIINVQIHIKTYNNPLGSMSDRLDGKIEEKKARLREIDKELKWRKSVDGILGTICDLGQLLIKINNLLQFVRSALYGVCLALAGVFGLGEIIWTSAGSAIKYFDGIIREFIWPVGIHQWRYPIGMANKLTCMVYTCQFMKVSGLVSIAFDSAALIAANNENSKILEYDAAKSEYDRGVAEGTITYDDVPPPVDPKIPWLVSNYETWDNAVKNTNTRNNLVYHDLGAVFDPGWYMNPYKSANYDDLCIPAQIYNRQKEKQLTCAYIKCLEKEKITGVPNLACDNRYALDYCLYVEGPESLLTGWGWKLLENLGRSALVFLSGIAMNMAYTAGCAVYDLDPSPSTLPTGWYEVGCGTAAAFLRGIDITGIFTKGPWRALITPLMSNGRPDDPARVRDDCSGLDYGQEE